MEQTKCYVIDLREMRQDAARKLISRGTVVRCAGLTIVLLAGLPDVSFAAGGSGIDAGANKIYRKLLNVGKWVIIIKGGIETIKNVSEGDFGTAKKNFLGYMITYAILWALPWGMKQIDELFSELDT